MIEIQCPRCRQYWYNNRPVKGRRARLCSKCVEQLPARRGAGMAQFGVFALVAVVLLVIDGVWIVLSACWPDAVSPVMLIYGCVLLVPSALWFSAMVRLARWGGGGEMDWSIHRWPLLTGLMGLACVLAYFSLRHPQ